MGGVARRPVLARRPTQPSRQSPSPTATPTSGLLPDQATMHDVIPARLIAAALAAGLLLTRGSAGAPGASERPRAWKPSVYAAARYASHRRGIIAFAVRTRTRSWGWHRTSAFPTPEVCDAPARVGRLLPAVGNHTCAPRGLEAVLQGRLGPRHGLGRPPGRPPDPAPTAGLGRDPHRVQRQPRLRGGDAARSGGAPPPRSRDRAVGPLGSGDGSRGAARADRARARSQGRRLVRPQRAR